MIVHPFDRPPAIDALRVGDLTWTNIERPGVTELEYLSRTLSLHPLVVADLAARDERAKLDSFPEAYFLVMHFASYNRRARAMTSAGLRVYVTATEIVTVHQGDLLPLVRLFQECQTNPETRAATMGRGSGYLLYRILLESAGAMSPLLEKLRSDADGIERAVFTRPGRQTLQAIASLRRDLITFRRVVRPQVSILAELTGSPQPFIRADVSDYWRDLGGHVRRLSDTLDDLRDTIDGVVTLNDAMTNHRLNDSIRILTIITAVMLPLTVISAIFGMNIEGLPFAQSEFAFEFVIAVMSLVVVGLLYWLRRHNWI